MSPSFLKRVADSKFAIALARKTGLRKALRGLYFRAAGPKDKVLRMSLGGLNAQFRVHTAEEFRILESFGGGEAPVLERVLSRLPEGAAVYDVGANVGLYTIFLAKKVGPRGSVVSFEPDGTNYSHLVENVSLNGLATVTCVQSALGEKAGEGNLAQGDIIGNYSLLTKPGPGLRSTPVAIVSGDVYAEEKGLPVPHLLKVDVEGFEYAVLQGLHRTLRNASCRAILIEVHPYLLPPGVTADMVLAELRSAGFDGQETFERPRDFHAFMWKTDKAHA
jgi:FkbM family methyltransferase